MKNEQQEAVQHITQGSAIALVSGLAGTGKTTMLRTAREAWENCRLSKSWVLHLLRRQPVDWKKERESRARVFTERCMK